MDTTYLNESVSSVNGFLQNLFENEYMKYALILIFLGVLGVIIYILVRIYGKKESFGVMEIFEDYGNNKNSK